MDVGICPGNYHDYGDDEIAIQREFEIGDSIETIYRDEDFPPNSRSLYFDPLSPPKGSIPNESIHWYSICNGEVMNCDDPVFYVGDINSCLIQQGGLNNSYFINSLRLLSGQSRYLQRLLVSNKFASIGLYTFKFYKGGKWRYVHIDDRIPCRQSGRIHYSFNHNPNECYVMLLEKAYAKLHGCYEAIAYGLIEKVLHDLTPSVGIKCLRFEKFRMNSLCDEVWDVLEYGMEHNALIGCGRFLEHPYATNPSRAKGISEGFMYQVVDVCVSSAEPTADLDAITVGMVCVRNMQRYSGRFTGRWSYGHKLWTQYKEIAFDLRHRTREIQAKRGLRKNPNDETEEEAEEADMRRNTRRNYPIDTFDRDDERDDLDVSFIMEEQQTIKMVQPHAEDLHWIQIEDFVDIFNRIYVVNDVTLLTGGTTKRYVSRWIPGDYIGGSGGPPILIHTGARNEDGDILETTDDDAKDQAQDVARESQHEVAESKVNIESEVAASDKQQDVNSELITSAAKLTEDNNITTTGTENEINDTEAQDKQDGDNIDKTNAENVVLERYAAINDNFTDNPMYPFTVTEPSNVGITLYQKDKRWNIGRFGENPREVHCQEFASRGHRLQACLRYPIGIGFLVVRLSGLKHRLTEFKLKKIVGGSEGLVFSNVASNTLFLSPGRYAIIPYTHSILDRALDYILHVQYLKTHVEFEIEDLLEQRLMDDEPSEVDEMEELQPDDNDLLMLHEGTDDVSVMSYERVNLVDIGEEDDEEDGAKPYRILTDADDAAAERAMLEPGEMQKAVNPPRVLRYKTWEYAGDAEELGIQHVFGEVGDVMKYVKTLRGEVRKLSAMMRMMSATSGAHDSHHLDGMKEDKNSDEMPDFMRDEENDIDDNVEIVQPVQRY